MKLIGALAVQHTKKKEQIGYLEYSLLMIKIYFIPPKISTLHFFEDQSDQGATDLVIKPFSISQSSRMESLSQKKMQSFPKPFFIFIYFFRHYIK